MEVVKAEIERLLKANFIQNTSYVDNNFKIVPIIKKNEKNINQPNKFRIN